MKIAVITEGTIRESIGEGHELLIYETFRRVAKENDVHILQPAPTERIWKKEDLTIHDIPPFPGRLGSTIYHRHYYLARYLHSIRVMHALRDIGPDVIDIFGFVFPTLGGGPAVVGRFAYYGKLNLKDSFVSRGLKLIRDLLTSVKLRKSAFLVMNSRYTEEQMRKAGKLRNREFVYMPNGIDEELFFPRDRSKFREMIGLSSEIKLVALVGQLSDIKRPIDFLEGMKLLPSDYHGVVVGRGPLEEKVRSFVKENDLGERVHLMGYVESDLLPFIYSAADVSAYMGELEIQPLVPQESMACGTPPVVCNAQGNNEIVEENVTGNLFEPGNLNDFANKVVNLCSNVAIRKRLSTNGIEFMRDRSWSNASKLTMRIYSRALEGAGEN